MRSRNFCVGGFLLAVLLAPMVLTGCGGGSHTSDSSPTSPSPPADLHGTWGGAATGAQPGSLAVTSAGGTLTFPCGKYDQLTEALTLDGSGHFDVTATPYYPLSVPIGPPPTVHLVGSVSGGTMTIMEVRSASQGPVYTLIYGQPPPRFSGSCPG